MSTSSADAPSVSVVVASNGAPGSVEACLGALAGQAEGLEVIVCEPAASSAAEEARYEHVRFLERTGGLVPELWRDGIDAATGEVVCLTISVMRPVVGWVEAARMLAAAAGGAGGAIEPAADLRLRDWAEYFARYARDMLPFEERNSTDLPGDNAVYTRTALDAVRSVYRDGFWEPDVNRELDTLGVRLVHSPSLVVEQGRSAGFRAFLRQRLVHGQAFGRQRGARFTRVRNVVSVLIAPLVPVLLVTRTVSEVFRRRRHRLRLLASMPLLLAYDVAWAAGEAAGHVASLQRR